MANLSTKTRKEQVLDALRAAKGEWVNTVDISNAQVGGSAGTSRVRDLRKEGYEIATRPHPDPTISQYQYRLMSEPVAKVAPIVITPTEPWARPKVKVAVEPPYIKWKTIGHSAKATHENYELFVYQNWDGNWYWSISNLRPGEVQLQGQEETRDEAMRAAAMEMVR